MASSDGCGLEETGKPAEVTGNGPDEMVKGADETAYGAVVTGNGVEYTTESDSLLLSA